MDDSELLARMWASMRGGAPIEAQAAPDSRMVDLDGVIASVTPATPDRSVPNSVLYESIEALERALPRLPHLYDDAGVRAWTVWAHETDERAAELLASAGYRLDASPMAMGMALDELQDVDGPKPDWSGDWAGLADAWRINDRAYGDPDGLWASAFGELPGASCHLYLARIDGEPASFVLVHDHAADCRFWFAATIPEARGRGLVSRLLHRALADARGRGLTTTTTQATAMGEPVYARIGYRGLGRLNMWERRRPRD